MVHESKAMSHPTEESSGTSLPLPSTIRNDAISSQRNVHPGESDRNGTYSDASFNPL